MPDETDRIVETFRTTAEHAEMILVTGGLGPTDDDLTREAVAQYLGVKLELHSDILEQLTAFFEKRGKQMAEKNRCQAYIPAGCEMLDNPYGTAPGFWGQKEGVFIAAMPGVPSEMKQMFNKQVAGRIQKIHSGPTIVSGKVRCFGPGESTVAQKLGDLMDRDRNPLINCTCGQGDIILHMIAQAEDRKKAAEMVESDKKMLTELLGDWVYGYDDQSLGGLVGNLLKECARTIALAESCTGGLLTKMLTDIPGSSDYLLAGWVTYSNEAKVAQLDVPESLIAEYGAVSGPVAREMAIGAARKTGSDIAVGITGNAGPGGGTAEKPVGLVYIGVFGKGECFVEECRFPATNRGFIRRQAALTALNLVRLQLQI